MQNLLDTKGLEVPSEIVKEVSKVDPQAYLFGSRNMYSRAYRTAPEGTDWDFAFPYCGFEEDENILMGSLGWELKPNKKYQDNLHFQTWEKQIAGEKVQLCSKIDLVLFRYVFENIREGFYWLYLHKSSPTVIPKEHQTDFFNRSYIEQKNKAKYTHE